MAILAMTRHGRDARATRTSAVADRRYNPTGKPLGRSQKFLAKVLTVRALRAALSPWRGQGTRFSFLPWGKSAGGTKAGEGSLSCVGVR